MEYEIGQEIELINNELGNITVKIEKEINSSCKNCIFDGPICTRDKYHLEDAYCSEIFRNDKKSIIYKQIKQKFNIMENFKMVTSESRTFSSIDELFEECQSTFGIIPTAAIKIEDKPYMPFSNFFDAIRTAQYLKNIANKQVSIIIYTPEFTETGTICLVTTVYE